jgi:hypothetical protein
MKRIKMTCALCLLGLMGSAGAALVPLEQSYELGLNEVTLPAHSASQVVIRRCAECDVETLPVNTSTTYFVGSRRSANLAEFRATAEQARPDSTAVYVFYKPETGFVTRIVLSLAG